MIEAAGRVYPVETRYRPPRPDQRLPGHVVGIVREALEAESGDVLVFLPGVGEIRRVEAMLAPAEFRSTRRLTTRRLGFAATAAAVLAAGAVAVGTFFGAAITAFLARKHPMLQGAGFVVAVLLLALFTPNVRYRRRWWW